MTNERCFFAHAGPCNGRLVRAHLIPRSYLKREYHWGIVQDTNGWRPLQRGEDRYDLPHRSLNDLVNDPRSWVPCCGGPQGISGHHGALDHSRTLKLPREALPAGLEEFAAELGPRALAYLDREYGARS